MSDFKEYELRLLFDLTLKLTKLRQEECKHLCIENAAPEILLGLIQAITSIAYKSFKDGLAHDNQDTVKFRRPAEYKEVRDD